MKPTEKKILTANKMHYKWLQPLLQLNFTNTRSFQNARWYDEKYCNNLNAMSMITKIDRVLFRYIPK